MGRARVEFRMIAMREDASRNISSKGHEYEKYGLPVLVLYFNLVT